MSEFIENTYMLPSGTVIVYTFPHGEEFVLDSIYTEDGKEIEFYTESSAKLPNITLYHNKHTNERLIETTHSTNGNNQISVLYKSDVKEPVMRVHFLEKEEWLQRRLDNYSQAKGE